jgi:hypothetical protein
MSSSRARIRLFGGLTGAAIGIPAGLFVNWLVGPTTLSLAIPAIATGSVLGAWLAPALIGADGVKAAAVGLGAGLLALPVVGFLIGIGPGAQQVLDGDFRGFVSPLAMALYVPPLFMNLVLVSVPAALAWATVTRRIANGPRQSTLSLSHDISLTDLRVW